MVKSTVILAVYIFFVVYMSGGVTILNSTFCSSSLLVMLIPTIGIIVGSRSGSRNLSGCAPALLIGVIALALEAGILRTFIINPVTTGTDMNPTILMAGFLMLLTVVYGIFYILGVSENQPLQEG